MTNTLRGSTLDKGESANVIIGTEFGIFSTDNMNVTSPSWSTDNSGLARVPVFTLKQYRTNKSSTNDMDVKEGDIFAGTFGRGTFQTTSLMISRPISVQEHSGLDGAVQGMKLFPNPAVDFTTMELDLAQGSYTAEVVDLNGRTIQTTSIYADASGRQEFKLNVTGLSNGLYIIGIQGKSDSYSRLMIAH